MSLIEVAEKHLESEWESIFNRNRFNIKAAAAEVALFGTTQILRDKMKEPEFFCILDFLIPEAPEILNIPKELWLIARDVAFKEMMATCMEKIIKENPTLELLSSEEWITVFRNMANAKVGENRDELQILFGNGSGEKDR